MTPNRKIEICWNPETHEVNITAIGTQMEVLDQLARATVQIVKQTPLPGLTGDRALECYTGFLREIWNEPHEEVTAIKIPLGFSKGGPHA